MVSLLAGLASVVAKAAAKKPAGPDTPPEPATAGFVWKPKDGGPVIELPFYDTVRPKNKPMWFEYQMEKRSYSLVAQIKFAMECAQIPEPVIDQVFDLPDEEQLELVNGWVKTVTGGAS